MTKYKAVRTNGFASKKEAQRARELQLLERKGVIKSLQYQPAYALINTDALGRAVKYVADFEYYEHIDGSWKLITEDVKGFKTPVYRLKRRMMYSKYGIEIRET